jgi:hypothetical protein
MSSKQKLLPQLRPTGDQNWDKTVPVAIGPNWLRGTKFRVNGAGDSVEPAAVRAFTRYLDAVEKRRHLKVSKSAIGTRSLQATALEFVIDALPWVEDGLEVLPRMLIEQLWGEFDKRLVQSSIINGLGPCC